MTQISAQQVYNQVLADGGTLQQAQVAAALVSGVESDGDPTELSGGIGPAAGLFQYEPGTWAGQGGTAYAPVAQQATWQEQVQVFVNGTKGNNFGAWGPDLVANSGDPNSSSNPSYGYSGAPQPGSRVGNIIAQYGSSWAAGTGGLTPAASPGGSSGSGGSGGGGGTAPNVNVGNQAAAPYVGSVVPGIPAQAPPFPDYTSNPANELGRVVSWVGEFAGYSLFMMIVFLFGAVLMLLGLVMLAVLFASPVAGPIASGVGYATPVGKVGTVFAGIGREAQRKDTSSYSPPTAEGQEQNYTNWLSRQAQESRAQRPQRERTRRAYHVDAKPGDRSDFRRRTP